MTNAQNSYQAILDVSFTRVIGGTRIRPVYGQPATDHALDVLDEKLERQRLTLPEEYVQFLREKNGFRGVDICFHGTEPLTLTALPEIKFHSVAEDELEYEPKPKRRDIYFSGGCNLVTFNRKLFEVFFDQLDTRIALGEMVDTESRYLFTFNYGAAADKQYERLKFDNDPMFGISELTLDGTYSNLITMFSDLTDLEHVLPLRPNLGRSSAHHKYVA